MGLVPWRLSRAGGDSARRARWEETNRLFAEVVREIGPDRIVFGSDCPEAPPGACARELRATLPLTEAEIQDLFDDRAPCLP